MRLGNILNQERVRALNGEVNAYNRVFDIDKKNKVNSQSMQKVVFPEPYENARQYYNRNEFGTLDSECSDQNCNCSKHGNSNKNNQANAPMFDMKSLLPMLMSGKFNDMINPFMSMLGGSKGGSGGMDFAKIFELFKPKLKSKKEEKKEEDISSKFDDFIIIED